MEFPGRLSRELNNSYVRIKQKKNSYYV
ncbi:BnaC09g37660D [Brassica napus]|uniref:BnaC09g37660D protein n=1 Tax=Brassica napus TaxID=3708 RepID=A0A078HEG5_BRANA|nr:BnaC09g37660D [Brassica napus]